MGQSPVSADTMVRTIHDMQFGLGGRLKGVITPPFRRTLRVNSHPAHRACEAWWWAAATAADRGLCRCVRVRSAPVGRVMGVASTVHCTDLVLRTVKNLTCLSHLILCMWPLLGGIRRLPESRVEVGAW